MALALVSRLHDLALDVENCHTLAQHPTYLPCLLSMLGNDDLQVVKTTMETIFLISKNEEARPLLANYPGMLPAIQQKLLSPNLDTKRFALSTYGRLQQYVGQTTTAAAASGDAAAAAAADHDVAEAMGASSAVTAAAAKTAEPSSFTIAISDSLDDDDRQILEDAILQLKGVISLFVDIYSRKCVVRTHTKPEPILAAICACGVSARLVGTPVDKENASDADAAAKKAGAGAGAASSSASASWFGWGAPTSNAVVRQGDTQTEEQQGSGWFGRIARSIWG